MNVMVFKGKKYFGLYSCLLGPWQKKCMDETLKDNVSINTISITPAAPFIKLSSITLMLSSLGKGLFFIATVDLVKTVLRCWPAPKCLSMSSSIHFLFYVHFKLYFEEISSSKGR